MFAFELFVAAFAASTLGGMLGMAGGVFVVPLLALFLGVELHTAIAASIVSVIACSCAGAAPLLAARLTNVRLAITLEVATTLGALTGVLLAGLIATRALFVVFAAVLAASAWQMASRRQPIAATAAQGTKRWRALDGRYFDAAGNELGYEVHRLPLGLALMYGAGVISALLGIGSGVLKIPAMDSALRLPIKVSSATSSFMIGVTAAASAVAYFARGAIVADVAAPVAVGSVLGALLGAKLMIASPSERLRLLFVIALAALCVQMTLAAFGVAIVGGG
ncbi:MAG TPA: sulfite exporter TauE/SafE family protein [Kofleriaceae bacterium]